MLLLSYIQPVIAIIYTAPFTIDCYVHLSHWKSLAVRFSESTESTRPWASGGLRIPPLGCLSLKSHRPDFQLRDAPAPLGLRRDGLLEVDESNEGSEALEVRSRKGG